MEVAVNFGSSDHLGGAAAGLARVSRIEWAGIASGPLIQPVNPEKQNELIYSYKDKLSKSK